MNQLMKTAIMLDTEYFYHLGFLTEERKATITEWLRGNNYDPWAAESAAMYLMMDADYFDDAEPAVLRQFWFFAPVIAIAFWMIKRLYRKAAEKIRRELAK